MLAALKLDQLLIFYCTAINIQTSVKLLNFNISITDIIGNTFNITSKRLVKLSLFGSQKYTEIENSHITDATIKCLLDTERFSGPCL